jgi:hypothetical protein
MEKCDIITLEGRQSRVSIIVPTRRDQSTCYHKLDTDLILFVL